MGFWIFISFMVILFCYEFYCQNNQARWKAEGQERLRLSRLAVEEAVEQRRNGGRKEQQERAEKDCIRILKAIKDRENRIL